MENFFQLLCELIKKKIALKATGEEDVDCKPTLGHCILTPRGHQKFNFDCVNTNDCVQTKTIIPSTPKCFCCPISNTCLNSLNLEAKHSKIARLVTESHIDSQFHSHDYAQDDSGIETSDSCDEKKEPCHRTVRRLHSRTINSVASALDESR